MKFYRVKISNQPDGKLIHNFPPPKIKLIRENKSTQIFSRPAFTKISPCEN